MPFIDISDLQVFAPDLDDAKAQAMIDAASAMAVTVAPCIKTSTDPDVLAAVKTVLLLAILRWNEAGAGGYQTRMETQGPFSVQETFDTRVHNQSGLFRPDEISTLQGLCAGASNKAFMVDTTPVWPEDD